MSELYVDHFTANREKAGSVRKGFIVQTMLKTHQVDYTKYSVYQD